MKTPPWIDPKTKTYKENYLMLVPGLNKPITEVSAIEFASAVSSFKSNELSLWKNYFNEVGWPEGFHYCITNYKYALKTGYKVLLRAIEIKDKKV